MKINQARGDESPETSADGQDANESPTTGNGQLLKMLAVATGYTSDELQNGNVKRSDIVNRLLSQDNHELIKKLRAKGAIRVLRFSDKVEDLGTLPAIHDADKSAENATDKNPQPGDESASTTDANSIVTLSATGPATDIWQALKQALAINQIAAIVLISDGQHTTPDDPVEIADRARDMGVPIYVFGVGDPGRPKNLFVSDVYVRSKAQPGEPFEIESVIYAQNISAKSVSIELLRSEINDADNSVSDGQTVKSVTIDLPDEGGRIPLNFSESLDEPGKYAYSVRISEVENESDTEDNTKMSSPVEIIDEKIKVLLIAGAPTWEYQMVQRLFQRDQSILLSCWLQTMDPRTSPGGR